MLAHATTLHLRTIDSAARHCEVGHRTLLARPRTLGAVPGRDEGYQRTLPSLDRLCEGLLH